MNSWLKFFVIFFVLICGILSFFMILSGDMTSAPQNGLGKIYKGENLNDVHSIMQSTKGEIYTLGYTCVQKFSVSGKFIGGAYFDSNNIKQITNYQFLSLSNGSIVILNRRNNKLHIFNDNFDIIDEIEVDGSYDKQKFYLDYPNTDADDREVKLSLFSNKLSVGNDIIKLEAPRNRLFSRDFGVFGLLLCIIIIFIMKEIKEDNEN